MLRLTRLPYSGIYWFSNCDGKAPVDAGMCLGFVFALWESSRFMEHNYVKTNNGFEKIGSFCIPKNASLGQLRVIFKRFLRDQPERWHERAIVLFAEAIRAAYCK
ncbi:Rap1a/Tai family immunity protein [Gimesia sp.]|uniref:Rap1a/Tai family immunity protein n=1 Tax=Gimesia sp. TaxID=2024833 RepID=UPI003A94E833